MARVLFLYSVIATKDTVETSAPNPIGGYVGHMRKAAQKKMEKARGGLLFINEAYELGKALFGDEAVGQLLNNLILPEFMGGNTVVILGGYEKGMHKLLKKNAGLKSQFASYVKCEGVQKSVQAVCSKIRFRDQLNLNDPMRQSKV